MDKCLIRQESWELRKTYSWNTQGETGSNPRILSWAWGRHSYMQLCFGGDPPFGVCVKKVMLPPRVETSPAKHRYKCCMVTWNNSIRYKLRVSRSHCRKVSIPFPLCSRKLGNTRLFSYIALMTTRGNIYGESLQRKFV